MEEQIFIVNIDIRKKKLSMKFIFNSFVKISSTENFSSLFPHFAHLNEFSENPTKTVMSHVLTINERE